MKKRLFLLIGMVLVSGVFFLNAEHGRQALAGEQKDKIVAPAFDLNFVNGGKALIPNNEHRYTVILFWTTWCPHCAKALKDLSLLAARYSDKIDFYGIGVGETPYKIQEYIRHHNIDVSVAADPTGHIARLYFVRGVPTIAIVDKDGYMFDYGYALYPMVKRLLDKIKEEG